MTTSSIDPIFLPSSANGRTAGNIGQLSREVGWLRKRGVGGGGGGAGGSGPFALGGILGGTTAAATANITATPAWAGLGLGTEWRISRRSSDSHFLLSDLTNTKTIMDVVPNGPIAIAYEPGRNSAALSLHQNTTWDANQSQSSLRTQINHSAGFSNGFLGRANGDQMSDDRVAGTVSSTTLNGAITASVPASAGALTVTSTTGFPTSGGVLVVDSEWISYAGISGSTFTGIVRGYGGTTAAAHSNLATVSLPFSLRIGHGFVVTSGSGFNDRGSLVGPYNDITIDEVCRTVTISASTNATPVAVTYAGVAGAPEWIPPGGTAGLATGDTVLIAGTTGGIIDGYWKVTVVDATHFTLDGSTAPGSTTSVGTVQKLVYGETDAIFANVKAKRRGSYAWAAELNNVPQVVTRGGGVLIDVTPTLPYSSWNNTAILGSTSEWLNTGARGMHIALRDSGTHAQGGTGLFITGGNSTNHWQRAIVVNNGATPNAVGTDIFCVDGSNGYIGSGATSDQTDTLPARLTLGSTAFGTAEGIQFGTGSGVVQLYRSAANELTLADDLLVSGAILPQAPISFATSVVGGTGYIGLQAQTTTPSAPATDRLRLYVKLVGGVAHLFHKNTSNVETDLTLGSGGATGLTSAASGTLTPTGGADTLTTQTTASRYVLALDLSGMANGDVVEVRLKTKVLSGGTSREAYLGTFSNVQAQPQKYSNVVYADIECVAVVTRTAGSVSSIPWSLLAF